MYIVYKHTNTINQKVYIGITKNDTNPNARWRNGMGYCKNDKFFTDIIKYGWDNFSHEILEKDLTELEALQKETYYIDLYDAVQKGYNNSRAGNIPSEQGIQNIRQALIGIKRNKASIDKQMQTKNERYGILRGVNYRGTNIKKVKCNETGDIFASIKEAERWCGTTKVGECCNKKRAHAGKHPETGEILSWSYANDNDIVTIECNQALKEKKKIQKVQCIETKKIYNNATEANRDTGIASCNILRVCKGERKTAGKMHWIFINEEE